MWLTILIIFIVIAILLVLAYVYWRFYIRKDTGTGEQYTRLRVTNQNSNKQTVWIQQLNIPDEPDIVMLEYGKSYDYNIPDEGVASVRVWPKTNCDDSGNNCSTGQSIPPCPNTGCQPPFESKVEFTFGDINSSTESTDYDVSFADGYTLPLKVIVKNASNNDKAGDKSYDAKAYDKSLCRTLDFTDLTLDKCPTSDTLAGTKNVNLQVKDDKGNVIACIAPCQKAVQPSPWGLGGSTSSDPGLHMCCPTPCNYIDCKVGDACNCAATSCSGCTPSSDCTWSNACATSDTCSDSSDPNSVVNTDYYKTIKKYAPYAYGYAYDDNPNNKTPVLMSCSTQTQYEVIFY